MITHDHDHPYDISLWTADKSICKCVRLYYLLRFNQKLQNRLDGGRHTASLGFYTLYLMFMDLAVYSLYEMIYPSLSKFPYSGKSYDLQNYKTKFLQKKKSK